MALSIVTFACTGIDSRNPRGLTVEIPGDGDVRTKELMWMFNVDCVTRKNSRKNAQCLRTIIRNYELPFVRRFVWYERFTKHSYQTNGVTMRTFDEDDVTEQS